MNKRAVTSDTSIMGRILTTAGVYVHKTVMNLLINADWWLQLTSQQQQAVLEHEVLHLVLRHCSRGLDYSTIQSWDRDRWNVATDIVCNTHVEKDKLPEGCHFAESYNLPTGQTAEWYYKNLPEDQLKKLAKVCRDAFGQSTLDDHGFWIEGEGSLVEKEATVAAAVENAMKHAGSLPGDLEDLLAKLNGEAKVPWQHVLKRFMVGTGQRMIKWTKKRYSKRFKTRPGVILKPKSDILIAVDVSGSISNKELQAFFVEVDSIHRQGICNIKLIQFDADVKESSFQDPYMPGEEIEVHGRGGTMFVPVFEWVVDNNIAVDSIVLLTDGCNYDQEQLAAEGAPGIPVLWIIATSGYGHNLEQPFGEVVELDVD